MASLAELYGMLSHVKLTEKYSAYGRDTATPNVIWDKFVEPVKAENMDLDQVEWVNLGVVRTPAPLNFRGQPARMLAPTGGSVRRAVMCRYFNQLQLSIHLLQGLRKYEEHALQRKGMEEVRKQYQDFATRNELTKRVIANKLFTGEDVHVDGNGNVLESSSGAVFSWNGGIPAENRGQLPRSAFFPGATGNIIPVPWSDPSALIIDQQDDINRARQARGRPPFKHAVVDETFRRHFRNNAQVKEWYRAERGGARLDEVLSEGDSFKLGRITYWFDGSTYAPATGGLDVNYVNPAKAAFFPDLNAGSPWVLRGDGLELVPKTLELSRVIDPTKDLDEVYGDFAYLFYDHNPGAMNLISGSNFLNTPKAPEVIMAPTVVF